MYQESYARKILGTSQEKAIIRDLHIFQTLFPFILTDNGSEFSNPKAIEYDLKKDNGLRTSIYYCNAGCL
ncbi:hypothetical protein [Desulfosporosinus meridiei]|uniref:hypothetical protein n=1 Tax=Desulfosporosinus meridiei TaxID=79209 RepID=UPI000231489A